MAEPPTRVTGSRPPGATASAHGQRKIDPLGAVARVAAQHIDEAIQGDRAGAGDGSGQPGRDHGVLGGDVVLLHLIRGLPVGHRPPTAYSRSPTAAAAASVTGVGSLATRVLCWPSTSGPSRPGPCRRARSSGCRRADRSRLRPAPRRRRACAAARAAVGPPPTGPLPGPGPPEWSPAARGRWRGWRKRPKPPVVLIPRTTSPAIETSRIARRTGPPWPESPMRPGCPRGLKRN